MAYIVEFRHYGNSHRTSYRRRRASARQTLAQRRHEKGHLCSPVNPRRALRHGCRHSGRCLPSHGRFSIAHLAQMKKCLLDSSFVIDLLNEMAEGKTGPALTWLRRNALALFWITPVTM